MLNSKGQEAAPFELLIAVIVMTFVIIVGMSAIDILNKEKCKGEIESEMETIKTALETTAKGEGKESFSYQLPVCYRENESEMKVVDRDDKQTCSFYCGGSRMQCTLLLFSTPQYSAIKCLRIPTSTIFPAGNGCDPTKLGGGSEEYEVEEWKQDPIRPGRYTLMNESTLLSETPIVCVYRTTGS